ncbi:helicase/secretion neighborhood TadE-like protein [Haloechinothrix alba]|uniref:Helicase/secretion neighborhood TadE-like protein n=1 Tax=Haloechinothrix alba TaxID=664784 RepID=A0A238XUG0_9PSEU|nr:Rv3654c family TadE-like protein [Haloechinothrix alba]SNR62645.1 helicase/secretion neighborhood TadE-like protein [Haloechinothrix alba]
MTGPGDEGFATVWAAGAVLAVLTFYGLLIWLGAATVTRHRVAAAADLAALAAAAHVADGSDGACAQAGRVARRMDTRLRACELDGRDALVRVRAQPPLVPAELGTVTVGARAGPVGR